MDRLPESPAEARQIGLATMTTAAAKQAIAERLAARPKDRNAARAMARLIHQHGRKYTDEAREWSRRYAAGEVGMES